MDTTVASVLGGTTLSLTADGRTRYLQRIARIEANK
jgi:hypothetical protein